ncbi:hypothetical protein [Treponema vincentii]|uniref:hypothetical protein n=1 Tax=Treponema vincentii TaxID=69710 RepID=UPI001E380BD6|nr:hypothetical protein [Treponema vincentii]
MRPVKSFIEVLLYISFFPQLASGPIVQAEAFFTALPDNLTQDVTAERPIAFDRSVLLILSGLYKKDGAGNLSFRACRRSRICESCTV